MGLEELNQWQQGALLGALLTKAAGASTALELLGSEALQRNYQAAKTCSSAARVGLMATLSRTLASPLFDGLSSVHASWLSAALEGQPPVLAAAIRGVLPISPALGTSEGQPLDPGRRELDTTEDDTSTGSDPQGISPSLRFRLARRLLLPFDLGPPSDPRLAALWPLGPGAVAAAVRLAGTVVLRHCAGEGALGALAASAPNPSDLLQRRAVALAASGMDAQRLPQLVGAMSLMAGLGGLDRRRLAHRLPREVGRQAEEAARGLSDQALAHWILDQTVEGR